MPPPTRVETELGAIDVWVNVAFTSVFARFVDIEPEEFRRVTEVTYLGYVHGTRAALRRMLPRDRGTIVQVGSALGQRGIPLQTRLLRRQACPRGVSRVAAHRADARAQQRARHASWRCRRSTPRSSSGSSPGYRTRRDRSLRSTSPRWRLAQSCTPRSTHGAARTGWAPARRASSSPTASWAGCSTVTWPAPASVLSRPPAPAIPTNPRTSGSPPTGATGATSARTARSTRSPCRTRHRRGLRSTECCSAQRLWPREPWPLGS